MMQPWAMLMAIDAKRVETRGWSTNFRGWVAIHASKRFPGECLRLCDGPAYFWPALHRGGVAYPENLPRGQILAVTEIIGCRRTEHVQVTEQERAFGNYTPGRYAIFTAGVRRLKHPITIKGALGLWRLRGGPLLEGHDF